MMKDNARVFLALFKVLNVDPHDFCYKFGTGRLFRDGEICTILCEKQIDVISSIQRGVELLKSFSGISIDEMKKKKWITRSTIGVAKKIHECYSNNVWNLK